MVKYTKDRVINLEESSSSEDWTDSTSEEEEDFSKNEDGSTKVVRTKKTRYAAEIEHAIGYSIIKRIGLKPEVKKKMLRKYQAQEKKEMVHKVNSRLKDMVQK